jgi:hypothetical protein
MEESLKRENTYLVHVAKEFRWEIFARRIRGRGDAAKSEVLQAHLKKNAVGEFVLPGLLNISTLRKPAAKARKGINPFTKEEVTFKAKPASTVVKVRPLKGLMDMAV